MREGAVVLLALRQADRHHGQDWRHLSRTPPPAFSQPFAAFGAIVVPSAEAKLFKDAHGGLVPDTRKLGFNLDGHFGFADFEELGFVRFRREPFPDRVLDVGQGLLAVLPCEWQPRNAGQLTETASSCSISMGFRGPYRELEMGQAEAHYL